MEIKKKNLHLTYDSNFLSKNESDELYNILDNIEYNSDKDSMIFMFGKYIKIPRKQVAYGEPGITYNFSGTRVTTKNWNTDELVCKKLIEIRDRINNLYNVNFNYVLINRYQNGNQYIGPHSDDERDLMESKPIIGISVGSERIILFESQYGKEKLLLEHGSMFAMHHPTNKYWKHSIPKDLTTTPRISLTFRCMN